MADKTKCEICDKTITPNNSPSFYDSTGEPYSTSYPICDKCTDKFGKSDSDDDD